MTRPVCEDCGEGIPLGRRRTRCNFCKKLVCSYCLHHGHGWVLGFYAGKLARKDCEDSDDNL